MAGFLSADWLAELAVGASGLADRPGVAGSVRFVVTGTPLGRVEFLLVVADGRVVDLMPGRAGDADATVTWKYPEAVSWFRGDLDPDVAYMTGRCKVEGDYAAFVFGLRPVFGSRDWSGMLADLAERTDFG